MAKKKAVKSPKKHKSSKNIVIRKVLWAFLIILGISVVGSFIYFYGRVLRPNMVIESDKKNFVYIKSTDSFQDVVQQLADRKMLTNKESFIWMAEFLDYDSKVLPGRYALKNGMNNKDLILLLRSGKQEPLRITFKSIRTKNELVGKVGQLLEADSLGLLKIMNSSAFEDKFGLDAQNALSLIIPDTYEFYWNTTNEDFIEKMGQYHLDFWNDERLAKASKIGLSKEQVSIMASIVQQESLQKDEWPVIAGVYMNRFNSGMKLQADPTVVYATGDFTIRRVRRNHLAVNSPFNTYMYNGLPPGPIYLAGKQCIDAVLDYKRHNYIYFCARPDRSGLHDFAKTYQEHLQNARNYQRRLNERGI
jgi:UPF0755 protein